MTKSELIKLIAVKLPHLPQRDVELAVNSLVDTLASQLAAGNRIEIRGFGGFALTERPPRMGRNPKTGEQISLPRRYIAHFKAGLDLRLRVDRARAKYPVINDL